MIGCIVTGHGDFAPGLAQAVSMIAGPQRHLRAVPFREAEPLDAFEASLRTALGALLREGSGVLIFTDVMGGTPFRTAMLAANEYENVEVLTGTNLPMLLETSLLCAGASDAGALARRAVEIGSGSIQRVRLQQEDPPGLPADDGEGI